MSLRDRFSVGTRGLRGWTQFTEDAELISLAGGLPDTSLFGAELLTDLWAEVARDHAALSLQYGPTRGLAATKACVQEVMRAEGMEVEADELIITTGGQQVLDLVCRTFLDPGDVVICEGPTFPGALLPFAAAQARVVQVATDADGLRVDLVADAVARERARGREVKLIYCVPTFQNPGGMTMSLARRHELLRVAGELDLPILEDNPYGLLRFEGAPVPTLRSLDRDGRVLYLGTFSKVLGPGLRIGWLAAPPEVLDGVDLVKQCADLCAPTASQLLIAAWFGRGGWRDHVELQARVYRERRDAMVAALRAHLPPGTRFEVPAGGLFLWLTLPGEVDSAELLDRALERKVMFVPGRVGYVAPPVPCPELRLNFSGVDAERLTEGVRRLGATVEELPAAVGVSAAG